MFSARGPQPALPLWCFRRSPRIAFRTSGPWIEAEIAGPVKRSEGAVEAAKSGRGNHATGVHGERHSTRPLSFYHYKEYSTYANERGTGIGRAMLLWAIEVYTSGASGLGLGWPQPGSDPLIN